MTTTFRANANELDQDFFERLKAMFKGKEIEIIVHEAGEMDETDYLLSDPANRKHILDAHSRVERREGLVEIDIDSLL
jgi:antitoxin YefM